MPERPASPESAALRSGRAGAPGDEVPGMTRAAQIVAALSASEQAVAVAESLTGGLVTAALTAVPGASKCVVGGVTAYATAMKAAVLDVDPGLLDAVGAVDARVAEQMAMGVRDLMHTDWGIATTGVAGPTDQDGHPPGTVFVAVCGPGGAASLQLDLRGDREQVRAASVAAVLDLLAEHLGLAEHGGL